MTNGTAGQPGVAVVTVSPGSAAEAGGMVVGDVIVEVDGQKVSSTAQLQAAVAAGTVGEPMLITVVRGDATLVLSVVPAAAAA